MAPVSQTSYSNSSPGLVNIQVGVMLLISKLSFLPPTPTPPLYFIKEYLVFGRGKPGLQG